MILIAPLAHALRRLRCIKGWHTLTKYRAIPYVTRRDSFGQMVVRAAYGQCDICKHNVYLYTPATPRWQRGSKLAHKIYKTIRS